VPFFPRDRRFLTVGVLHPSLRETSPTHSIRVGAIVAAGVRAIVVRPIPIKPSEVTSGSHQRLTTSDGGFSAAQSVLQQALVSNLGRTAYEPTLSQRMSTQRTLKDVWLETVLRSGYRSLFLEDTPWKPILGCVGIKIAKSQSCLAVAHYATPSHFL